jgi:hypothetical protein
LVVATTLATSATELEVPLSVFRSLMALGRPCMLGGVIDENSSFVRFHLATFIQV